MPAPQSAPGASDTTDAALEHERQHLTEARAALHRMRAHTAGLTALGADHVSTEHLKQVLYRLEQGQGTEEDLQTLLDLCDNILGRSFCALGDGATSPITSSIQYFREEYVRHLTEGGCPFDPVASSLFAGVSA